MKKLIYTSYDGDNIHLIELFISFVLNTGNIPVNPTNNLGYYLSTTYYENNKFECVKDCVSLELICDELWIFSDNENHQLPEGVIFEFLEWKANKGSNVKIIPIDIVKKFFSGEWVLSLNEFDYSCDEVYKLLNREKCKELEQTIFLTNQLRSVLLLDLDDKYFKYADWVKQKAFEEGYVPLITCVTVPVYKLIEYQIFEPADKYYSIIRNKVKYFRQVVEYDERECTHRYESVWTLQYCSVPKYVSKNWAMTEIENNENNENNKKS
ncbi:hypothetical protein ACJXM4_03500 [Streptococcus pneumoniae]